MDVNSTVLVLNADYSLINKAPLKRVINLYLSNKVDIVKYNEGLLHPSIEMSGIPTVVALKRYIHIPYKKVSITRKKIFERDNYECQYCGKNLNSKTATIDHVYPKSRKGSPGNTWTNMVACCNNCNNYKGDNTPSEIGMKLRRQPFTPSPSHYSFIKKNYQYLFKND